jgi:transposase
MEPLSAVPLGLRQIAAAVEASLGKLVSAAAERLHLHVNTAYYRLERIAERTGCDLRRLAEPALAQARL